MAGTNSTNATLDQISKDIQTGQQNAKLNMSNVPQEFTASMFTPTKPLENQNTWQWGGFGLGLFIIAAVVVSVLVYITTTKIKKQSNPSLELLKQRYINGEIDHQTYLQMKKNL